jgi:hypothetical protein
MFEQVAMKQPPARRFGARNLSSGQNLALAARIVEPDRQTRDRRTPLETSRTKWELNGVLLLTVLRPDREVE